MTSRSGHFRQLGAAHPRTSKIATLSIVTVFIFGLSSCAADEQESERPVESAVGFDEAAYANEQWELTVANVPSLANATRPNVSLVRFIEPGEFSQVMMNCLIEAGITNVELTDDGEGFFMKPESLAEHEASTLARYVCTVKYPIEPRYSTPLNREQLENLYDYFVGPQKACLEGQGYQISQPPSKERFIENYYSGDGWDPFIEVVSHIGGGKEQAELANICPKLPANFYD